MIINIYYRPNRKIRRFIDQIIFNKRKDKNIMTKDEFINEWKHRTVEIHMDYNPVMLTINTIRKVACISTVGFDTLYLIHNGYMIYIYNSLSAFAQAFADPAIDSCFLKFRINSIDEFWDLLK